MNNRLKFRVWDKSEECYVDPVDCAVFYIEPNGEITIGVYNNGDVDDVIYCKEENICVEQCTGLKDKNSRLIYEGDFLINHDGNIGFIEFKNACFMLTAINEDNIMSTQDWTECEVIGNIHENADLLNS